MHFEIEDFALETDFLPQTGKVKELIDKEEERQNHRKGVKDKSNPKWKQIQEATVLITPFKLRPKPEHFVYLKDKKTRFPFWFSVTLHRSGKMYIPDEIFPIFQRKYLEPLADEATVFTLGTLDDADLAATLGKEEYALYADYIAYVNKVFRSWQSRK